MNQISTHHARYLIGPDPSATIVYAVLIANNEKTGLSPPIKYALVIGLSLTFISTVIVASYLSSHGSYLVLAGEQNSKAGGFPVMGWSRDTGDIRVSHFFATHAMHFIPLFALLICCFSKDRVASILVIIFSIFYLVLIAGTFIQALYGNPFLPFVAAAN